jgi:hypothetical protein
MSLRIIFVILLLGLNSLCSADDFFAYHTKVQHSATDYMNKYSDIIVVVGEDMRLEFTRQSGYLPVLKTSLGVYQVDDLYPGRDGDFTFYYNYVRLLENTPEKIMVHWRYFPNADDIDKSVIDKDPLYPNGFLGVVHELFTIYPDGKVERIVKEAKGTTIEEWNNSDLEIKQTLFLKPNGIDHGSVQWSSPPIEENEKQEEVNKKEIEESVIEPEGLTKPLRMWRMDEGLHEDEGMVMEEITEEESFIEGINIIYKKGVSGTALALDGYYSGYELKYNNPKFEEQLSIESWIALDVYPYNDAPIIHQSKNFGKYGYYFGVDAYGHLFFRINGKEIKSNKIIPLYKWQHVAVSIGKGTIKLFQNGNEIVSADYKKKIKTIDTVTKIGLNTEKGRCTDYVRTPQQNLPFIFGLQGVVDEIRIYDKTLSGDDIRESYLKYLPENIGSPVKKGMLPGEIGIADKFGAYYKNLKFQDLWDNLWRTYKDDIVIKFDHIPTSVIFWRGSNYAANWITEKNHWMSDQSSEIWGVHGCSEHMADKQVRHSYARIIENTPARVVVHWRYPCVDVGYICESKLNWSDEFHTIYPDGTGIRKVHWNRIYDKPGFQDIQFFTNPGETALDVVELQAMTVANISGDVEKLQWKKPNHVPKINIKDATIELLNTKSKYKIFVIFQGGNITPWGSVEQSAYTDDPFAGPWNHWPMHFVPSDGRFAVAHDRVTHFALGANDWAPQFGSLVHYGFTDQSIETIIPYARYWQNPPVIKNVKGAKSLGFYKDEKAYIFNKLSDNIVFKIDANKEKPVVNPCFVLKNWKSDSLCQLSMNGTVISDQKKLRQGITRETDGSQSLIVWLEAMSQSPVNFRLTK